jgi:serine/threonine protein kinase
VSEKGEIKIADFGVSANGSKRRTIVGSPYWMVFLIILLLLNFLGPSLISFFFLINMPQEVIKEDTFYDNKADIWR